MNSFWLCYYWNLISYKDHSYSYKVFYLLYYPDAKDIVFVWFCFLVCKNYFKLFPVLVMLEICLKVCLEWIFWSMFLFLALFIIKKFSFSSQLLNLKESNIAFTWHESPFSNFRFLVNHVRSLCGYHCNIRNRKHIN